MKLCFFFHKWQLTKQMGVYDYHECSKCETRKYNKRPGWQGYSAVDWDWLTDCPNPRYGNDTGPH